MCDPWKIASLVWFAVIFFVGALILQITITILHEVRWLSEKLLTLYQ